MASSSLDGSLAFPTHSSWFPGEDMWGLALGGKDSVDTSKASDKETWSSAHKEGNQRVQGRETS